MSELIGRRTALSTLIGAGLGLTAAASAQAAPAPDHQLKKLEKLFKILENADDHLGGIIDGWVSPPEPDRPVTTQALQAIIDECTTILNGANLLVESMRA
jgi:hypothetical protein